MDLNKEAEKYCQSSKFESEFGHGMREVKEAFKAGANSKYVQAKILQAQIDVLNKTIDIFGSVNFTTITGLRFELKQQLNQLENETNNKQNTSSTKRKNIPTIRS